MAQSHTLDSSADPGAGGPPRKLLAGRCSFWRLQEGIHFLSLLASRGSWSRPDTAPTSACPRAEAPPPSCARPRIAYWIRPDSPAPSSLPAPYPGLRVPDYIVSAKLPLPGKAAHEQLWRSRRGHLQGPPSCLTPNSGLLCGSTTQAGLRTLLHVYQVITFYFKCIGSEHGSKPLEVEKEAGKGQTNSAECPPPRPPRAQVVRKRSGGGRRLPQDRR